MYRCPGSCSVHVRCACRLSYYELVGGVLVMPARVFQSINGYSNLYWGWGGEDDDIAYRLLHAGHHLTRPPFRLALYTMMRHKKRRSPENKRMYLTLPSPALHLFPFATPIHLHCAQ